MNIKNKWDGNGKSDLKSIYKSVLRRFDGYTLFLLFIIVYALYHIHLTSELIRPMSMRMPYGILIVLIIVTSTELIVHLKNKDVTEVKRQFIPHDLKTKILPISWPFIYLVSFLYVGFFSSTFLLTLIYIIMVSDLEIRKRVIYGIATASILTALFWLFFIQLLGGIIFLEYGFLP